MADFFLSKNIPIVHRHSEGSIRDTIKNFWLSETSVKMGNNTTTCDDGAKSTMT